MCGRTAHQQSAVNRASRQFLEFKISASACAQAFRPFTNGEVEGHACIHGPSSRTRSPLETVFIGCHKSWLHTHLDCVRYITCPGHRSSCNASQLMLMRSHALGPTLTAPSPSHDCLAGGP